jgi:hypothetical protein
MGKMSVEFAPPGYVMPVDRRSKAQRSADALAAFLVRLAGYTEVVYLVRDVEARPIERAILAALAQAGHRPVRGREYFGADALPLILATVDALGFVNEAGDVL